MSRPAVRTLTPRSLGLGNPVPNGNDHASVTRQKKNPAPGVGLPLSLAATATPMFSTQITEVFPGTEFAPQVSIVAESEESDDETPMFSTQITEVFPRTELAPQVSIVAESEESDDETQVGDSMPGMDVYFKLKTTRSRKDLSSRNVSVYVQTWTCPENSSLITERKTTCPHPHKRSHQQGAWVDLRCHGGSVHWH